MTIEEKAGAVLEGAKDMPDLRDRLARALAEHGNEKVAAAKALMLASWNKEMDGKHSTEASALMHRFLDGLRGLSDGAV